MSVVDGLSVAAAAEQLGVNRARVHALIKAGDLSVEQFAGRCVIPIAEINRFVSRPRPKGRPWSARRAFDMLNGDAGRVEMEQAAPKLYGRAQHRRYFVLPELADDLLADPRVRIGGAHGAAMHGAPVQAALPADVYVYASDADGVVQDFVLRERPGQHNVVVHLVDDEIELPDKLMPMRAAWLDLVEYGDRAALQIVFD